MSSPIRVSVAVSLGMHAMAILALYDPLPRSVQFLAEELHSSETHLAKVFQRLGKMGLIRAFRGRTGGYRLAKNAQKITLLEIHEAIEGPYDIEECLFSSPVCRNSPCLFGELLWEFNSRLKEHLANTALSELCRSMHSLTNAHPPTGEFGE